MEEMARRHIEPWLQGLLEDEVERFSVDDSPELIP